MQPLSTSVLIPHTKFHWNRTIGRWFIAKKSIFKMAAAAILNFKNFNFSHVTVIVFDICCSVPNFIKIGCFFTEIWWFSDLQNDPYLPIHYATFMCLRWRLRGVLRWASPLLSDFWAKIFWVPSKMVPKMALFRGNGVVDIWFYVRNPEKAHPWAYDCLQCVRFRHQSFRSFAHYRCFWMCTTCCAD